MTPPTHKAAYSHDHKLTGCQYNSLASAFLLLTLAALTGTGRATMMTTEEKRKHSRAPCCNHKHGGNNTHYHNHGSCWRFSATVTSAKAS